MSREALLESVLYLLAVVLFVLGFGISGSVTPLFELSPKADRVLRVMTWNVGGSGENGEWGSPLLDEHLDHVVRVVREIDPDLCFLQEVRMGQQAHRIQEALGEAWVLELARSKHGRKVIAIAQRGQLETQALGNLPRDALGLLYSPAKGTPLFAVGLHADVSSAVSRNEEIGAVAEFLSGIKRPVVLVGDLNIDLDLDKRRDLFTDNEYLDVETYNFVAARLRDAGRGTGSTAEPDRRLDYIFVEDGSFEVLSAGPLKNRRFESMDHDPVIADLIEE